MYLFGIVAFTLLPLIIGFLQATLYLLSVRTLPQISPSTNKRPYSFF